MGGTAQVRQHQVFQPDRVRLPAGHGGYGTVADQQGRMPVAVDGFNDSVGPVRVGGDARADE